MTFRYCNGGVGPHTYTYLTHVKCGCALTPVLDRHPPYLLHRCPLLLHIDWSRGVIVTTSDSVSTHDSHRNHENVTYKWAQQRTKVSALYCFLPVVSTTPSNLRPMIAAPRESEYSVRMPRTSTVSMNRSPLTLLLLLMLQCRSYAHYTHSNFLEHLAQGSNQPWFQ